MSKSILLKNVTIIDPNSAFNKKKKDVLIENGIIAKISGKITPTKSTHIVEEKDLHICPGLFDLLVNFGEPGYEHKETLASGCNAAMHGGFTGVGLSTETDPARDNKSAIEFCVNATENHLVDLHPYGTITKSRGGKELSENGINDSVWCISNLDNDQTWVVDSTVGLPWSNLSACMKLYSYSPRENQKDGLLTPNISLSPSLDQLLTFDVAYQQRSSSNVVKDTLKVYVSTNCGESFDYLVYEKYDNQLSTFDTVKHDFIPEFSTHWRNDTINLSQFANQQIIVKFETINRQGNNLYLDNIKLFEGQIAPVAIAEEKISFIVYPNPAQNKLTISSINKNITNYKLAVYNSLGKQIKKTSISNNNTTIFISDLSNGIYFVKLYNESHSLTKSFVKWKN